MSQILQLQIPDPLFKAIEREAAAQNTDAAAIATAALEAHFHAHVEPEKSVPRVAGCLEDLFGTVDLGHPTGLDNESIDADLVKDYSRGLD